MKQLRFVCAQPASLYYAWQVEVMINNFMEMGVDPIHMDIVCAKQEGVISKEWEALAKTYPARFFFYDDQRTEKGYSSSIRPNILKQHWKAHPYLKDQAIFYHDNDILFTKPINTWISPKIINDEEWYGSDTLSYIAHSYIKAKGEEVLNRMCELMGLPVELIEAKAAGSIGAQYLMKNVTYEYWDRVESDSELLFKDITALNVNVSRKRDAQWAAEEVKWRMANPQLVAEGKKYPVAKYNPLQIWCSDMWSVLWGAWRLGYNTTCLPEFEFSWAVYDLKAFERCNIMHNAGVINPDQGYFYKSAYTKKLPYKETIEVKENSASKKYWDYVVEVGKRSCLLETNLEIIQVIYGNKDVTSTISKNELGPITLFASNTIYGDPMPNIVKTLQVTYKTKNGICKKIIAEGEKIVISAEDVPDANLGAPLASYVEKTVKNIFFFWEGYIHGNRLKILQDAIYSTRIFNIDRPIYVISNTLQQSIFEAKFNIKVIKWDYSFFDECGLPIDFIIKHYLNTSPRELSDLMRLVVLHKFGGSYVDTDDLCLRPISNTPNTICRSYDPHTSFYNHITPEQCVPGKYREIPGYDHLNMFPRNDCWQNFTPGHYLIYELLNHPKIKSANKAVYITDDVSWQALINETVNKYADKINTDFSYKLTLLYLYEDFVAGSSLYDLGKLGGELHDIYKTLPGLTDYPWGRYKCTQEVGKSFQDKVLTVYPGMSHMWLHLKEAKTEWFEVIDPNEKYSLSTWIYTNIRKQIQDYQLAPAKQFSVIIPTLWCSPRITQLLKDLENCPEVGEIILIDNNNLFSTKGITNSKLRVIPTNENSYVNPAWNLGVQFSKFDHIALCNDDINFDTKIFKEILPSLDIYGVIGQDSSNYHLKEDILISEVVPLSHNRPSGWGCLIFIKKDNWIPIPSYLKIACGDDFLIDQVSRPGILVKFKVASEMSTTSIRSEFFTIQDQDAIAYKSSKQSPVKISILTLTYQRHWMLEEAIQSFLTQDFKGDAEMVIINDSPEVKYHIADSRVRIINCPSRFSSIGQKLAYGYKQCKYDNIYRLDDDDLLTPGALNIAAKFISDNPGFDIYRAEKYYYFLHDKYVDKIANTNTGNIFTKQYLDRIVFPDKNVGEDLDILHNHNATIKTVADKGCTMIYRWGNQTYHISAMPDAKVSENTDTFTGKTEKGIIVLHPKFNNNYYIQLPDGN